MRSLLIRCYPARWRQRYGDEFLAILEERPLGPYDVADIFLGALDARLRSRRADAASTAQGRGLPMSLRVGGVAAIIGAVILAVSWFGTMSGALPLDGRALVALIFVGLAALLLALTILSAFQARELPRLVWTAFVLAAVGAVGYTVGMITLIGVNEGDVTEGGQTFAAIAYSVGGVAAIVGFALFGIATFRSAPCCSPSVRRWLPAHGCSRSPWRGTSARWSCSPRWSASWPVGSCSGSRPSAWTGRRRYGAGRPDPAVQPPPSSPTAVDRTRRTRG